VSLGASGFAKLTWVFSPFKARTGPVPFKPQLNRRFPRTNSIASAAMLVAWDWFLLLPRHSFCWLWEL
jgi:hypothetical protein